MRKEGNCKGVLADYFPMIQTKEEIRKRIDEKPDLKNTFCQWNADAQEEFLEFCSGEKGLKVVYDGVFKEVFNPETAPERLEALLSLVLKREVRIETVLPNDSVRLGAESSLLYTDIIVQQTDGSLSNVEIQKIGYAFPGERCACYSADHVLRQYKRVRGERNKGFDYRKIKKVYTVVFFEHSPKEFWNFPKEYLHSFRQQSNTGLKMELLQEYYFVPLDIYRKNMDNKPIRDELEAWLAFLSYDEPERILELITQYPKFKAMYQDIYEMCMNMERVMSMYSKELEELDRNTVLYMIDEMQAEIDLKREELEQTQGKLDRAQGELEQTQGELDRAQGELEQTQGELEQTQGELDQAREKLVMKDQLIQELQMQLEDLKKNNRKSGEI